jgi:hypothetical protein
VKRGVQAAVGLAILGLLLAAGHVSYQRTRAELAALAACEALSQGDVATALAKSEGDLPVDASGRALATCRCRALQASGRGEECASLLAGVFEDPTARDWLPAPDLATFWIASQRASGRTREAADFARRAGAAYPEDASVFAEELATRASVEDEADVVRELAARIPPRGEAAARMRVALAQRALRAGDGAAAAAALGAAPPEDAGAALGPWFDARAVAAAFSSDMQGVQQSFAAWGAAGGDPVELRARYALTLSISGLADPQHAPAELLRAALAETKGHASDGLRRALAIRLVQTLANAKRTDEALAVYDAEAPLLTGTELRRDEIVRAARLETLGGASSSERRGALAFHVADAKPGDVLWISPEPDADADAPYEALPVPPNGVVEARRAEGMSPQRWVLRDAEGRLRGSGTVSPVAAARTDVAVAPHEPGAADVPFARARKPADGRRRLMLVLLDCGDWRISAYLRARGELPVLDALLRDGHRAVLDSDPPLTAAALESMVTPERESGVSVLGLVHRLGGELAGLESVGSNPFEALSWVLPESADLFATIGAGDLRAANLLLAHGGIRAGRHGEVVGPHGAADRPLVGRAERELEGEERTRFPELTALESARDAHLVHGTAAELDAAVKIAREGAIDFLALRVEPLDILTHAHFGETVADGQDDGRGLLFSVYRYIDSRLAVVDAALDADDVLIVMSDHGIRTAMEHSRDAMFVAVGGGVPAGRAPGRPALRGVSRTVADLLGVATRWPDTGVATFAASGHALAAREHRSDPSGRL